MSKIDEAIEEIVLKIRSGKLNPEWKNDIADLGNGLTLKVVNTTHYDQRDNTSWHERYASLNKDGVELGRSNSANIDTLIKHKSGDFKKENKLDEALKYLKGL